MPTSRVRIVAVAVLAISAFLPAASSDGALKESKRLKLRAVEREGAPGVLSIRVKTPWPEPVVVQELVGSAWETIARGRPGDRSRLRLTSTTSSTGDSVVLRARVRARNAVSREVEVELRQAAPDPPAEPEPVAPLVPRAMAVGFNNNAVSQGVASPAQSADLLAAAGADIDRVQINWGRFERSPGTYDFALSDSIYAADLARGVRPLFILGYAPRWASGSACAGVTGTCHAGPAPDYYDDYARAAAALAKRYPDAAGIEVWNEPNVPHFWRPAPDPGAYAALLRQAYAAVKVVDPALSVAGGSVVSTNPGATGSIDAPVYLTAVFEAGAAGAMDAISMHAYAAGDRTADRAVRAVQDVRGVRDALGVSSTPIWVTETGWSTTGAGLVSEVDQAAALGLLDTRLRAEPGVAMLLIHTLVDPPLATTDAETGFGVVRSDLSRKPAFCTLAFAWADSASC